MWTISRSFEAIEVLTSEHDLSEFTSSISNYLEGKPCSKCQVIKSGFASAINIFLLIPSADKSDSQFLDFWKQSCNRSVKIFFLVAKKQKFPVCKTKTDTFPLSQKRGGKCTNFFPSISSTCLSTFFLSYLFWISDVPSIKV